MDEPTIPYKRLTRPVTSVGTYRSLWLGPDHLMFVTSTGYSEEYQRFQFRDIKGFFTTPTDRRLGWSVPWAILALFSGIALINSLFTGQQPVSSGPLFLISLLLFTWNLALGPSCIVHVVTGVQTIPAPSLVRRRKARKILAILVPLIAAAQADMAPPALAPPGSPDGAPSTP